MTLLPVGCFGSKVSDMIVGVDRLGLAGEAPRDAQFEDNVSPAVIRLLFVSSHLKDCT